MTKKTLKLKQLAEHLGIPVRTLYRMLGDGRFPVEPIANTKPRLWNTADVNAWLESANKCKT